MMAPSWSDNPATIQNLGFGTSCTEEQVAHAAGARYASCCWFERNAEYNLLQALAFFGGTPPVTTATVD